MIVADASGHIAEPVMLTWSWYVPGFAAMKLICDWSDAAYSNGTIVEVLLKNTLH